MQMSNTDIAKEYRTAKSPRAQIGVLAELNACSRQEIADILIAQGETVPKYYQKQIESSPAAEKVIDRVRQRAEEVLELNKQKQPEPITRSTIRSAAVDVIDNMLRIRNIADPERRETASRDFEMQLRGVMALVHQLEESRDDELEV